MWNIIITLSQIIVLFIMCVCIKNLYHVYTLYPKGSTFAGHIAWGIVAESIVIIQLLIKILT
jgi:hypothetical protein